MPSSIISLKYRLRKKIEKNLKLKSFLKKAISIQLYTRVNKARR